MGSGELVATNEPTVIAKPFLDAIVVKDSQGDGCFPVSTCVGGSNRYMVFERSSRSGHPEYAFGDGGGNSPGGMLQERKTVDPMVFETVDLV